MKEMHHNSLILTIDSYFLILAVIVQIFILVEELVIPTEIQFNKTNAEIGTQPLTVETKINKCST